jgi:hypothetical protein
MASGVERKRVELPSDVKVLSSIVSWKNPFDAVKALANTVLC